MSAELALCAEVLLNPASAEIVATRLDLRDVEDLRLSAFLGAVVEEQREGGSIDVVSIHERMKRMGHGRLLTVEQIGGLADHSTMTPPRRLLASIRNGARGRRLARWGADIGARVVESGASEDVVDLLRSELEDLAGGGAGGCYTRASTAAVRLITDIRDRHRGAKRPIPTGFNELTKLLDGGFEPGDQVVVAGRPGMGKTAYAMSAAMAIARLGHPVYFWSGEMRVIQMARRAVVSTGRVGMSSAKKPSTPRDLEGLVAGATEFGELPIALSDRSMGVDELAHDVRRWRRDQKTGDHTKPGLIVVDYLQLLQGGRGAFSREQQVSEQSRKCKQLAQSLGCVTMVLSQLNRGLEKREDKRPLLSDLRESGALEQDANSVIALFRPWVYDHKHNSSSAEAIVLKNRDGKQGAVDIRFEPEFVRYLDLRPHEQEARAG